MIHKFALIFIVSSNFLLGACSQQSFPGSQLFGNKTSREIPLKALKEINSKIKTTKSWEVKTASAMGENKIHPLIIGNSIYIAGARSASAWDKKSGKLIWKTDIGEIISAGINSSVSVGQDHIFIGTTRGNAISLNAKTGEILWIERLSSEVLAVSPSKDNRVAFRTVDGKLHGLSAKTGELLWQRAQRTPALTLLGASVPIILGNLIIAGFDNGKIAAYQLSSGQPAWETTLALPRGLTELDKIIDIDGKIKPLGNALFAASLNGSASGIQAESGKPGWLKSFSTSTGVNASSQGLYSSDDQGNIWKLSPQSGEPIWKMDDLKRREPTLPVIIGPSLAVIGDKQGNIHWINTTTGKVVARNSGDKAGYSVEPEVSGNAVYSIGKSGVLSKITLH